MARFNNRHLIPNLIPQTLNILLYAITVQNKNIIIVIKLETEAENTKF